MPFWVQPAGGALATFQQREQKDNMDSPEVLALLGTTSSARFTSLEWNKRPPKHLFLLQMERNSGFCSQGAKMADNHAGEAELGPAAASS